MLQVATLGLLVTSTMPGGGNNVRRAKPHTTTTWSTLPWWFAVWHAALVIGTSVLQLRASHRSNNAKPTTRRNPRYIPTPGQTERRSRAAYRLRHTATPVAVTLRGRDLGKADPYQRHSDESPKHDLWYRIIRCKEALKRHDSEVSRAEEIVPFQQLGRAVNVPWSTVVAAEIVTDTRANTKRAPEFQE